MKLIIDIPEHILDTIQADEMLNRVQLSILQIHILKGTPLDDVKAEMEKAKRFHVGTFEDDNPIDYGIVEGFDKAIAILDNIGKKSEEE